MDETKVAELRKLRGCGMVSAVGEYTPNELWEALDCIERLRTALTKDNSQTEHFEREWYLDRDDAERYRLAKTLEGQVVTMETFKTSGAAALDQALDDLAASMRGCPRGIHFPSP